MIDFTKFILGNTSRILILDTQEDNLSAMLSLMQQSKLSVKILSQDLDPDIFNTPTFLNALVDFIKINKPWDSIFYCIKYCGSRAIFITNSAF